MLNRILLILTLYTTITLAHGQQLGLYTQYMFNQLAYNPAYAGIHEGISMSALAREQWIGFEGAPSTQTFSIHSPLKFKPVSLGAMFIHDRIGVTDHVGGNFSYAYRIRIKKTFLSFGLQGSIISYRTSYNTDGISDPSLANADVRSVRPNFGTGIMWHSQKFYAGISAPFLLNTAFDPTNPNSDSRLERHYFGLFGYVFVLSPLVKLKPNVLIKYVQGAPTQIDLNFNALFKDLLWVGLSYRSLDSFDALIQFQLSPQWQIGYAFDFLTTSDIRQVNSGSHEIMINYIIPRSGTKILTPRYF